MAEQSYLVVKLHIDGTTNATLPKGARAEEVTLAEAARLLAARREAAPAKKKRTTGRARRAK